MWILSIVWGPHGRVPAADVLTGSDYDNLRCGHEGRRGREGRRAHVLRRVHHRRAHRRASLPQVSSRLHFCLRCLQGTCISLTNGTAKGMSDNKLCLT